MRLLNEHITVKEIRTVADLSEAVALHRSTEFDSYPFFRGMASNNWLLQPKAFRNKYFGNGSEQFYATNFKRLALSRHTACPGPKDYGRWLTIMQHYGLPTRMLDWTESAIVAAFFALCFDIPQETKDDKAAIWCLNATKMNAYLGTHLGIPDLGDLEQDPKYRGIVTGAFDVHAVFWQRAPDYKIDTKQYNHYQHTGK